MKKADGWQSFLETCLQIKNQKKLDDFFKFIFTGEEMDQIATRMLVTKQLLKGDLTQREISQTYQISIAKITRGSNALKLLSDNAKKLLHSIFNHTGK